ncbi:endonuclease/exonuclease/phosphatase family protein [Streptomyces oceani]|uniref:Endonuclease n=1 Tax=Streptomyces oceani TaxID=1075402 RepID=A0A1E7KCM5_9ACTN|nr:endonuclease/exonuclease/phosphatase family protein [Streptomyces oceani]OEV01671.1 endonuclease [Streptomyces oceani]
MTLADLPESRTEADGSAVVRLLSYNIRAMRDDREALVRVIRACAPDVVCVQEAPRFFRWRKYASWLARRTDLCYVTGGATACGPMILSSLRAYVEHTEDIVLPRSPGLHRRGFATALLRFGSSARLSVTSCHLSLQSDERYAQAARLAERLPRPETPHSVVAADLNERPGGRSFRLLTDSGPLRDVWASKPWGSEHTHPAAAPRQRIDAVLATDGVEVLGGGVPVGLPGIDERILGAASDHRPVLTALRVPPARP